VLRKKKKNVAKKNAIRLSGGRANQIKNSSVHTEEGRQKDAMLGKRAKGKKGFPSNRKTPMISSLKGSNRKFMNSTGRPRNKWGGGSVIKQRLSNAPTRNRTVSLGRGRGSQASPRLHRLKRQREEGLKELPCGECMCATNSGREQFRSSRTSNGSDGALPTMGHRQWGH